MHDAIGFVVKKQVKIGQWNGKKNSLDNHMNIFVFIKV